MWSGLFKLVCVQVENQQLFMCNELWKLKKGSDKGSNFWKLNKRIFKFFLNLKKNID